MHWRINRRQSSKKLHLPQLPIKSIHKTEPQYSIDTVCHLGNNNDAPQTQQVGVGKLIRRGCLLKGSTQ